MIELTILGNPVARKSHRHLRNGLTYDPSKTDKKVFLKQVEHQVPRIPIEGPIKMELEFYVARPKNHYRTGKFSHILKPDSPVYKISRPDIDNYIKLVLDALNKVFYKDDSQIHAISATKEYSPEPKTIVRIAT